MSRIIKGNKLYESYTDNSLTLFHIYEKDTSKDFHINYQNIKRIGWIYKSIKKKLDDLSDLVDDYSVVVRGEVFTKGSTDSPMLTLNIDNLSHDDMKKYIKLYTVDILLTYKHFPLDIRETIRILIAVNWILRNVFSSNTELYISINDFKDVMNYSLFNPFDSEGEIHSQHCGMVYNHINGVFDTHTLNNEHNDYLNRKKNLQVETQNMLSQQFNYKFMSHNIYLADKEDSGFAEVSMKVNAGDTVTGEEIQYLYNIFKKYIYADEIVSFYINIEGTLIVNKKYQWLSARDVIDLFVLNIDNRTDEPEYIIRKLINRDK